VADTTLYTFRDSRLGKTFTGAFAKVFAIAAAAFNAIIESRLRNEQIQRLQALSDQELVKRGISRDWIVYHVYRDQF